MWMDTLFTMFNVGINELTQSREELISVYPNPGKNLINIFVKSEAGKRVMVTINDLSGVLRYTANDVVLKGGEVHFKWQTDDLADGVYMAVIEITDNITGTLTRESKKIVLKR
jgi:hypothetical protein